MGATRAQPGPPLRLPRVQGAFLVCCFGWFGGLATQSQALHKLPKSAQEETSPGPHPRSAAAGWPGPALAEAIYTRTRWPPQVCSSPSHSSQSTLRPRPALCLLCLTVLLGAGPGTHLPSPSRVWPSTVGTFLTLSVVPWLAMSDSATEGFAPPRVTRRTCSIAPAAGTPGGQAWATVQACAAFGPRQLPPAGCPSQPHQGTPGADPRPLSCQHRDRSREPGRDCPVLQRRLRPERDRTLPGDRAGPTWHRST